VSLLKIMLERHSDLGNPWGDYHTSVESEVPKLWFGLRFHVSPIPDLRATIPDTACLFSLRSAGFLSHTASFPLEIQLKQRPDGESCYVKSRIIFSS
jgi:hypothetical protein